MHILIGIGAVLALLYFWLLGHWFARVLVFLLLALILGAGLGALSDRNFGAAAFPGMIGGPILAWFVGGIPTYYQRYQLTGSIARPRRGA